RRRRDSVSRRAAGEWPQEWMPIWLCSRAIQPRTFARSPTSIARSAPDAFSMPLVYSTDLAYVHDAGFSDFARRAVPELVKILSRHGIRRGLIVDVGCGSGALA